ncbi:unnamed protein product [Caenorhabditis bovis]|uniref:TrmE-type G domain-containing protein n=1 Tax=Caenorhabditis bovis TaxID=2654633 RepID=A0A8S1F9G8_9PELO|nr:unnamed protein product [Caenorhabditis bovis]
MSSTIFALSSGSLPSAIAVFRISGPKSLPVLQQLSRKSKWPPRMMKFTPIYNQNGVIDEAMAVFLPGPKSFTGEDTAELFVHGSPAVARELAYTLARVEGVREARRGEFTRRAFFNGKMSLNEADGLRRLIESRTETERRYAFGQMRGGSKALEIREKFAQIISQLYVIMDFGEHVHLILDDAKQNISNVLAEIEAMIRNWRNVERIQRGLDIVLYGRPNSGKSSILNRLASDEVAIVSPIAGTTRDAIEISVEIGGVRCRLTDTAGIRSETSDGIEKEGIRRANLRLSTADIVLIVVDPETSQDELDGMLKTIRQIANSEARLIGIRSKSDLNSGYPKMGIEFVDTSTIDENGIHSLRRHLEGIVEAICPEVTYLLDVNILQECAETLNESLECDDAARICARIEQCGELIGELTSTLVSEDVLDNIFSKFCIGK